MKPVIDKIEPTLLSALEDNMKIQVFIQYQPDTLDLLNSYLKKLSLECAANDYQVINLALLILRADQLACLAELDFVQRITDGAKKLSLQIC